MAAAVLISRLRVAICKQDTSRLQCLVFEIMAILQTKEDAPWAAFVSRTIAIIAEDIADPWMLSWCKPHFDVLFEFRRRGAQIQTAASEKALVCVYKLCKLLLSSQAQTRSLNVCKALMIYTLNPEDFSALTLPPSVQGSLDVRQLDRLCTFKGFLFNVRDLFKINLYTQSGRLNNQGKWVCNSLWNRLLLESKVVSDSCHAWIRCYKTFWETRWVQKDHYLFILKSSLILLNYVTYQDGMWCSAKPVTEAEIEQLKRAYLARGRVGSGVQSCVGLHDQKQLGGTGVIYKNEVTLVPADWGKFYKAFLFNSQPPKRGPAEACPGLLPPLPFTKYVVKRLPTPTHSVIWLVYQPGTKKSVWVKRCDKRPHFQLNLDSFKSRFGLRPMNLRYDKLRGVLIGTDYGKGFPYETKIDTKYSTKVLSRDCPRAAVRLLAKTLTFLTCNARVLDLIRILMFRFIFSVCDTHLGNIILSPEGWLISVDETRQTRRNLLKQYPKVLFTRLPTKAVLDLIVRCSHQRAKTLRLILHNWRRTSMCYIKLQANIDILSDLFECFLKGQPYTHTP